MYFSHICHFRPMTQPNPLQHKFSTHSRPSPTQPNPRVNPTHGQLCFKACQMMLIVNTWCLHGGCAWFLLANHGYIIHCRIVVRCYSLYTVMCRRCSRCVDAASSEQLEPFSFDDIFNGAYRPRRFSARWISEY